MKENIYRTSSDMYTATYALILVFVMLTVVTVAIALKFSRTRALFIKEKKAFKDMQIHSSFLHPSGQEDPHLDTSGSGQ